MFPDHSSFTALVNKTTGGAAAWVDAHFPAVLSALGAAAGVGAIWLGVAGHMVLAAGAVSGAGICLYFCLCRSRSLLDAASRGSRLSELHFATIEALALAIDAKDKTAASHIRRVQHYAGALARAVDVSSDELQGIMTAALLHDVGKLAIPEHILSKPGRLTEEEFQKIRIHPQVGFQIIEHVPFPYPVAPLVLCHHERWDGKGYPLGLKGTEIPLGARVLAVADYFDSLTRERPYHKQVPREVARTLLQQEAYRALDPDLVDKFLEILPGLAEYEAAAVAPKPVAPTARLAGSARLAHEGERTAFENIAGAHHEIYALYELAQAIGSTLDVADTMSVIAEKLKPLVPFSCCALFVRDEDEMLRCRFAVGTDADDIRGLTSPPGYGLAGWVTRNRRSVVTGRRTADSLGDESVRAPHLHSALATPLIADDRVLGALAVYHIDPGFYTDEHRRLLDRVAQQAAAAISNSIVFEQTRKASLSDSLTGLPNSRFMLSYLGRELARAERLSRPVAILVADLDHFKQINDTYGHHVGDRALREVARVLRDTIRPYDICVRYAGDEFIVVLPDCGEEEAEAKRLELQAALDSVEFEAAPGQPVHIRLSIGAAVFPLDGTTYESLLAAADGRMYRDKRNRKSRASEVAVSQADPLFGEAMATVAAPRVN